MTSIGDFYLKIFLFLAVRFSIYLNRRVFVMWNHFSNFGKRNLKKHFCEIILKSGHWHRRCRLKVFLFLALVANLYSRAEPFWLRVTQETIL